MSAAGEPSILPLGATEYRQTRWPDVTIVRWDETSLSGQSRWGTYFRRSDGQWLGTEDCWAAKLGDRRLEALVHKLRRIIEANPVQAALA